MASRRPRIATVNKKPRRKAAPAFDVTVSEDPGAGPLEVGPDPGPAAYVEQGAVEALSAIANGLDRLVEEVAAVRHLLATFPTPAAQVQATTRRVKAKVEPEAAPPAAEPEAAPPPAEKPARKAPPAAQAPAPEAPPSLDDVRSRFLAFASQRGREAAKALLSRFGAEKVAGIPTEQLPAFLAALEG